MKDDVFAVIADPTRRHIIQALAVERLAVGELVEELGVSQPTVSKHLRVLRTAGLVETEADGQKRFYSITPEPLEEITAWINSLLEAPRLASPAKAGALPPHSSESSNTPVSATPASGSEADHPAATGITFTPLTPFTPALDYLDGASGGTADFAPLPEPPIESTQAFTQTSEAVVRTAREEGMSRHLDVLAQSLNLGETSDSAQDLVEPLPQGIIEAEVAARQAAEVARATETQASASHVAHEDGSDDERGILARLTRWSRRSSR